MTELEFLSTEENYGQKCFYGCDIKLITYKSLKLFPQLFSRFII